MSPGSHGYRDVPLPPADEGLRPSVTGDRQPEPAVRHVLQTGAQRHIEETAEVGEDEKETENEEEEEEDDDQTPLFKQFVSRNNKDKEGKAMEGVKTYNLFVLVDLRQTKTNTTDVLDKQRRRRSFFTSFIHELDCP